MRAFNPFNTLPLLLLWTFASQLPSAFASPPINVALDASFPAPPWILELLESAATEKESSFIPLLDSIANGGFSGNDEQIYNKFLHSLRDDGHITDAPTLASWKLALAVHEAAPRIQAHHQFWETSVRHFHDHAPVFSAWKSGMILCLDAACSDFKQLSSQTSTDHTTRALQFDRKHTGKQLDPLWTIYLDPSNAESLQKYKEWRSANGDASFRVRYLLANTPSKKPAPLRVSGYGVELALKRTDYIVIDDREAEAKEDGKTKDAPAVDLDSQQEADLKPLSSSELLNLGVKAASFIMQSDNPLESLTRLSQDFPKHAAALAQHNASNNFLKEHEANRELLLPPGFNILWVNGVQIPPRQVDVFSLLDHFRRERKLIGGIERLGFTAAESIALLSDPEIAAVQSTGDQQRYDWRDDTEGGKIIIWLNDVEKDKRYSTWSPDITRLLQRTYPGQMPSVRKDMQNIVFPVDLTNPKDVNLVVEILQNLVQRGIAARFGLVPAVSTAASREQARVTYYLHEAYGLGAVMNYLALSLEQGHLSSPSEAAFATSIAERTLRRGQSESALSEVRSSEARQDRIDNAAQYLKRLSADGANPPFFANGVPVSNDDDWMQAMSQRLSLDLRIIQQQVYEEAITQDVWLPSVFLKRASLTRNSLIVPEDETQVQLFDFGQLYENHRNELKLVQPATDPGPYATNVHVVLDMNNKEDMQFLLDAIEFGITRKNVRVALRHRCQSNTELGLSENGYKEVAAILQNERPQLDAEIKEKMALALQNLVVRHSDAKSPQTSLLGESLGLKAGDRAVLVHGRLVGPIPKSTQFDVGDFDTLVAYERKKRIDPVLGALKNLNLTANVKSMVEFATLTSLVARSTISDVPEGVFDNSPGPRMNPYNKWSSSHTCIKVGNEAGAPIEIVASLDPTSEVAQRWTPILKALSQIEGVTAKIFLNPAQQLQELPVKRFYRQVLQSEPTFVGGLLDSQSNRAEFQGIPKEALLTVGLDTPPSWLVAAKESEDDLDNIKLSSIKKPSVGVNALYELEHILIEGHSRDTTVGSPPRGVQLVLGTETSPNFAKTIIMANLGYFQFKANPGVYELALERGRSKEIFNIDSAGTMGYGEQPGDETTDILLMSFQGATVFPRLSRNPGKEDEDVLEVPQPAGQNIMGATQNAIDAVAERAKGLMSQGTKLADDLLAKAGLSQIKTGEYLSKGVDIGQNVLSNFDLFAKGRPGAASLALNRRQADINIFSVASGHLYERMLNIMILSVMKHTNHSVKFWFIEQFLSPSFKTFLPTMAAEYEFDYEMVTYRWPHWLRAQTEKQRIIWGYKILFLDVLFPLDLEKVIFVDADQIVRTDMYELVTHDLEGAPYGFTPMCDSRTEMEGFRFWKQGYWATYLRGLPYHISALYVVDLNLFRAMAAGDRLRQQYHSLSADPNSLSNLDQDLPNHMQMSLPIHSLPQDWLWCETWCDDESLKTARTIDLCNNPQTKEPKLDRARRQVPEWTVYDEEVASLARRKQNPGGESRPVVANSRIVESHGATSVRDEL